MESILNCKINRALIKKTDKDQTDDYDKYYHEAIIEKTNDYDALEKLKEDLDEEIELSIEKSGMLNGLTGKLRESSHETLRKVYYDIIVSKTKYERLRNNTNV